MTAPLLLFAHGAGAGISHPWMQAWIARLAPLGRVVPFEYPYMAAGKKRPDRLPKLLDAHRAALEAARDDAPVVLVGKSMGSRVGCHLSLDVPVDAVVCFGYPLQGGGKKKALRDEVLKAMATPVLFIQGTRDPLGPLDRFAEVRPAMQAPSTLYVVEDGDHSLRVAKRTLKARGVTQDDVDVEILGAVGEFLASLELR